MVVRPFIGKVVVLCIGGVGKICLDTSNPDIATGDGISVTFRADAKMKNMEFVKFIPHASIIKQKTFLFSKPFVEKARYFYIDRKRKFWENLPA